MIYFFCTSDMRWKGILRLYFIVEELTKVKSDQQ
ncbi:hypothetical protein BH23BAC3_BH23BAC3_08170 [soil metagenome]